MAENYPSPDYHAEHHLDAYDTRRVMGSDGSASVLAGMVEDILYPGLHTSLRLSQLSNDGQTSEAHFNCNVTLPDAIAAPWVTEQTRISISHIKNFGSCALKDSFDISVQQAFFISASEEPTVIANDYIIDKLAVREQSTFEGAVRRFSFDSNENRVYEEMTEYDAGLLFDVLHSIRLLIEKDAELQGA